MEVTLLNTEADARQLAATPAVLAKLAGMTVRVYAVRTLKGETRYMVSAAVRKQLENLCRTRQVDGVSAVIEECGAAPAQVDAAELARRQAERDYDNLHNEGADGYNPHRAAEPVVRRTAAEQATWEAVNGDAVRRALRGED